MDKLKQQYKNLTDPQRRKLLAAAEIVQNGDMAVLKKIIEFEDVVEDSKEKVESGLEEVKTTLETLSKQIETKLSEVKDGETPTTEELLELITPLIPEAEKGEPGEAGKDGKDGKDGLNGLDGLDGDNGKDGKDGSPDTRLQIVEKINTGKGKDLKIELKQIEGGDKMESNIIDRAVSILDQRTKFLINKGVKHDATLSGEGTDASPLTVVGGGDGGSGTVTEVSSANADISVATGTTTPVLTLNSATLPTASTIVKRDDSANIYVNNYFANTASTVSAGGTTTLTVASARTQNLTGAANQTFQLPDATTLSLSSIFEFNNNSSGTLTITNAGAVSQYVVPAGGAVVCYCTSISTANGTWDFHALAPQITTWSSGVTGLIMNSVLSTSPRIGSGASSSTAPSFIPQRGASTTGFGGDGTDLFATIAGTARLTISATGITATNLSGTNTGDQTIALTGDVTGTGTGSFATTIDKTAITGKTTVTGVGSDYILISDTSDSGNLKKALASDFAGDGGSGITRTVTSISVDTTAGSTASVDYVYFVTGTTTLTLPTAVGNTNRYTVKSISGTTVVEGDGVETIDGSANISIANEDSVDLVSNGTEWKVV